LAITKAVIVAGGRGTRFLPATLAAPKELLPIFDIPMLHYPLEEAVSAGLTQIILVSAPGKETLEHYATLHGDALAVALVGAPDTSAVERVATVLNHASVSVVHQVEPLGLGHAISMAAEVVGNEPFAVFLPDDIVENPVSVTRQMLDAYEMHPGIHVAVEHVPRESTTAYGIVDCTPLPEDELPIGRLYEVHGLVEKPLPEDAPSDLGIVGRYIFPSSIFDVIRRTPLGAKGEVQITDAMEILRREGEPAFAVEFEGNRYDVGNPLGHLRASIEFGMRRPDMGLDRR
jgi:UTP--glucose-1-phosphate uridylyltransferase